MADGALTGAISGAISGGMSGYSDFKANPQCFVAGTLIKTDSADTPIEEIEIGDYVWAWDEDTGEVALKRVVDTYVNESHELIHVFVNGEEIITTPTHPFYSPVKGWTDAVHLRAGDILVLVNGEYVIVEKVQHEILEAPITVYNFQVEDYHTYYVACMGVLVHNSCTKTPTSQNQMQQQVERGQAPQGVDSVHPPHVDAPNQQNHIHFTNGTSLNMDGTIHDQHGGVPYLSRKVVRWLKENGWAYEVIIK